MNNSVNNDTVNSDYDKISNIIRLVIKLPGMKWNAGFVAKETGTAVTETESLFKKWAGVLPDVFFGNINKLLTSKLVEDVQPSLFSGLFGDNKPKPAPASGSSINMIPMREEALNEATGSRYINYSFSDTPFGRVIIASTSLGVCYLAFEDNDEAAFVKLNEHFKRALFREKDDGFQTNVLAFIGIGKAPDNGLQLHVKGTDFQIAVWRHLVSVPMGTLTTYKEIAMEMNIPTASRAVGTAIGSNTVAILIPCHRVIRSSGDIGEFKWGGSVRKMAIIGWEAVRVRSDELRE